MKNEINRNADVALIGARVNEALSNDTDADVMRDMLLEIHSLVFPAQCTCTDGAANIKRALDEVKHLNIQTYARSIGRALEDTERSIGHNVIPDGWRVMSRETWNDCYVMLDHIQETLTELLPE